MSAATSSSSGSTVGTLAPCTLAELEGTFISILYSSGCGTLYPAKFTRLSRCSCLQQRQRRSGAEKQLLAEALM